VSKAPFCRSKSIFLITKVVSFVRKKKLINAMETDGRYSTVYSLSLKGTTVCA
jgi:hypothetical protein